MKRCVFVFFMGVLAYLALSFLVMNFAWLFVATPEEDIDIVLLMAGRFLVLFAMFTAAIMPNDDVIDPFYDGLVRFVRAFQ